jgi:acyl-coenzyme A synthetase/AMP-(fatty) acid ligase
VFFPKSHHKLVQPWLQERDMEAIEIGDVDKWFPQEEVPHFPYDKTFEEAEFDPVVVLHTSGSTGLPKPIVASVGMISTGDAYKDVPDFQGHPFQMRAWVTRSKRQWLPREYSTLYYPLHRLP